MPRTVVRVERLCKRYEIGVLNSGVYRYGSLRDSIADGASSLLRRVLRSGDRRPRPRDHIWALEDVSFRVESGEVVGIIGRNGAGKSTLLKILSRITRPTSGHAEILGRLGSLLEIGTGFHPELSGRDNIFLNGAILGMRRQEIARRFEEIVAFSGVSTFLDTPVKRYSSGMYMRLAFSVAAHFEPDILLVDEVLAVGDAEFQRKCLGKMESVAQQGRTVLFVSHNMAAVKALCGRVLLLDAGRLAADGTPDEVIDRYLSLARGPSSGGIIPPDAIRSGTGEARYRHVEVLSKNGQPVSELYFGQPIRIRTTLEVTKRVGPVVAGMVISTLDGTDVACAFSTDRGSATYTLSPGWYQLEVELDVTLVHKVYSATLTLNRTDGYNVDWVQQTVNFSVLNVAETGTDSYPWGAPHGHVRAPSTWRGPQPIERPSTPSPAAATSGSESPTLGNA